MGFNMQNEVLASRFLTKEDCGAGVSGVINGVTEERVGGDDERKFALHFRGGFPKPMLLNKVNTRVLVSMFGATSDGWIGKEIEVFNDLTVSFNGQIGGCRVRMPAVAPRPAAAASMTPEQIMAAYELLKSQQAAGRLPDDVPF